MICAGDFVFCCTMGKQNYPEALRFRLWIRTVLSEQLRHHFTFMLHPFWNTEPRLLFQEPPSRNFAPLMEYGATTAVPRATLKEF